MENTLQYTITPVWSVVRQIRKDLETNLSSVLERSYLDASLICATELIENALKYGESVANLQYIQFHFSQNSERIEISVSNGVARSKDLETVKSTIDEIRKATDPTGLYFERLDVLMNQPHPGTSQLGLLRIVNETNFKLDYTFKEKALTIIAHCEIKK